MRPLIFFLRSAARPRGDGFADPIRFRRGRMAQSAGRMAQSVGPVAQSAGRRVAEALSR
jgi:hypothetical protein